MERRKLGALELEYAEALQWLEGHGVRAGSRFHALGPLMQILWRADVMERAERLENSAELIQGVLARIEAGDLVRVHRAYGDRAGKHVRSRLRRSGSGPLPGDEEAHNDAQGRGHFAELSWGAVLEDCGFRTELDSGTDVLQIAQLAAVEVQLAWEVKRPWQEHTVGNNIQKGAEQVERAVAGLVDKGRRVDGGVVVVVLDHAAPQIAGDFRNLDYADAKERLRLGLRRWLAAHEAEIRPPGFPNVLGVLFWWRPMSFIMLDGRSVIGENHQFHFHMWRDKGTEDWRAGLIWDWVHRLKVRW